MNKNYNNLISINDLTTDQIKDIITEAKKNMIANRQLDKKQNILKGVTIINIFFENSTRTRTSFEIAGKRLGADVINISTSSSSVKKGESLIDTIKTINAMTPDFIVVRHNNSGALNLIAKHVDAIIINAGDGMHQHPTQALLDLFTIELHRESVQNMNIALCGDILHSRVARSNIELLNRMGANVRLISPPTLLPNNMEAFKVKIFHDMNEGLKDCDIIMMLRLQQERMNGAFVPSEREYFYLYGLDKQKLSNAKDNVLIMHPGPINRGVEIDSELADSKSKSLILQQVEAGVAIRQAIFQVIIKNR